MFKFGSKNFGKRRRRLRRTGRRKILDASMNWIYEKILVYQKLSGTVFTLTFDTRFYVKMQFRKDPQIMKA